MKYLYLIFVSIFPLVSFCQFLIFEDFENYEPGDSISLVSTNFSTWSGNDIEDVIVNDELSFSGNNSLYFSSSVPFGIVGGTQDVVLEINELLVSGELSISKKLFIPNGTGAYFNLQGDTVVGNIWTTQFFFNQDGSLSIDNINENTYNFSYPFDVWFEFKMIIDLNLNSLDLYLDNELQSSLSLSYLQNNPISGIDYYPLYGNEFWLDDILVEHTPNDQPVSSLDATLIEIFPIGSSTNIDSVFLVGDNINSSFVVYNSGSDTINSFNLTFDYNDISYNINFENTIYPNDFASFNTLIASLLSEGGIIVDASLAGSHIINFTIDSINGVASNELNISDNSNFYYIEVIEEDTISKTFIPDDNFEQQLIEFGYDDALDDSVFTINIKYLEYLNLNNDSISDLTGIQDFENLRTLYCRNNQLTSLDLSSNTLLEKLYCNDNELSSLNLSMNTQLDRLDCYDNQLYNLNLKNGNNINLTINSTNNPNLNCVNVDNPIYSYENWANENVFNSYIDFSLDCENSIFGCSDSTATNYDPSFEYGGLSYCIEGKTFIPDNNFEQLLINFGYDDVLDDSVSTSNIKYIQTLSINSLFNMDSIYDLTGIEDFEHLSYLDINGQLISELDLSNNSQLTFLDCRYNQLISLELSSNSLLEILYCSYNQLTNLDVSNNNALTDLDCSFNQISSINLDNNNLLENLAIKSNQIEELSLLNNPVLMGLECNGNFISELDLSGNIWLEYLNCSNNNLDFLDLRNCIFNNTYYGINYIQTVDNPSLLCINVDNPSLVTEIANSSLFEIDSATIFSQNCENEITGCTDSLASNFNINVTISNNDSCNYPMTFIPDDNFEQKLIEFGYDDELNDSVLTHNIKFITYMNLNNDSINNLTGIEDFINLETLLITDNNLTNLNLSQNIKLKNLYCSNNELSDLNIDQNIDLETLDCAANELTELDLSNNLNLKTLHCLYNNIMNLNISQNIHLEELNCSNNDLSELNLTQNIDLETLDCASNELTELDLSNNLNLKTLHCLYNNIMNLNISQNIHLEELNCSNNDLSELNLTQNIHLEDLKCSNNDLSELNLTQNINLKTLVCVYNQLTSLDVTQNSALNNFNCFGNQLTSLDLSNNLQLQTLNCSDNQLTSLDVSNLNMLDNLYCSYNQLISLDISLSPSVRRIKCNNNQLTSLDLRNGQTNWDAGDWVLIGNNPQLFCIDVDDPVWSNSNWTVTNNNIDYYQSFSNNCQNEIFGCNDTLACNYNSLTTIYNLSCSYIDSSSIEFVTDCYYYEWNDSTYFESGTYTFLNSNQNGCDSLLSLDLTLFSEYSENNVSIMENENYTVGGNTYSNNGTYIDTLQNIFGCDSIVTTNLNVIPLSYNCNLPLGNGCLDPMDGTGYFSSLENCETNCVPAGIIENTFNTIIYPNPSSNTFNTEYYSEKVSEVIVTNILGEQVYFESIKSIGDISTKIDLSKYSKGIYNLTIKTSEGISNHKLILQ